MKILFPSIVFIMLLQISCSESHLLSPSDYISWVESEESGLHRQRTVGKIKYDLQYKPVEYIYVQEQKNFNDHVSLAARKKELEGLQYYQMRIALDKGN